MSPAGFAQAPVPTPREDIRPLEAIKFFFGDTDWKHNLLMGALYMFIPFVGQLCLYGWHCETMQRLVRGHAKPIPKLEFSDFGHYLSRGLPPFLVILLCALPFSIIASVVMVGVTAASISAVQGHGHATSLGPTLAVAWLLFMVVLAGMWIPITAGWTRAELTEDVGTSISPAAVFAYVGKTWAPILKNFVLYTLICLPLVLIGYLACFIGIFPVSVAMMVGFVHLRYQIYLNYLYKGGAPIPVKAPVWLPSESANASYWNTPRV